MFDFRTKFVTALVWVLAAIQLMMQPAAGLLHSGCEGHSHSASHVHPANQGNGDHAATDSLWLSLRRTWHWLTHSGCCHHSERERAVVYSPTGADSDSDRTHRCSAACAFCSHRNSQAKHSSRRTDAEGNESQKSPVPPHDSHDCAICMVVFAARLNTAIVQLPERTDPAPLAVIEAVSVVEIAPHFMLPSRGPPSV